jgi:hypothetical protein
MFQYVPHMLARDFRHLPMSMAKWQRPRDYAKWDHKDPCQCRSRQLPKSSWLGNTWKYSNGVICAREDA